jgi:capsular exopolysaccharide synthesis family protein
MVGTYTYFQTPIYEARSIVSIEVSTGQTIPGVGTSMLGGRTLTSEVSVLRNSADLGKRIVASLRERETVAGQKGDFPILWNENGKEAGVWGVLDRIRESTTFEPRPAESLVMIRVESSVPEEASTLANIYAEEYKSFSQEQARASIRAAREFLEQQVEKRQAEIRRLENQWKAFAQSNSVVTRGMDGEQLVAEYAALSARKDDLQFQLEHDQSTLALLKKQLGQFQPRLRDQVMSERETSGLRREIEVLEERIGEMRAEAAQYFVANPGLEGDSTRIAREFPELGQVLSRVDGLEQRRSELTDRLVAELAGSGSVEMGEEGAIGRVAELRTRITEQELQISQTRAQISGLTQAMAAYEPQLRQIPEQRIEREQLERRIEQAESFYTQIAGELQRTVVAEESELGYVEQLRQAGVPGVPIRPNVNQNIILGILLGIGLGIGLAFLREALSTELRRPEDLQRQGFHVLGVIPDVTQEIKKTFQGKDSIKVEGHTVSSTLLPLLSPWSPVTENYRLIRTNLQSRRSGNRDRTPRTLLVTSPEPGDGKTTTTVNLALTFVLGGKRVLLIDADMRRPNTHRLLGMDTKTGLADVLRGDRSVPAVRRTFIDGLFYVPAGRTDAPPTESLESGYMKKLIEIGTEKCDVVIIDSPPVLAASDPLVLATQCESTILVASAGTTERSALRSAQEMLQDVGANIGGVIFNRMDLSAASGGYRGYGYYGYDRDPYLAPQTKKKYSLLRKSA